MQNWDDLRYFLSVARNGSFIAAAESLSVNGSTVGRRIDQLEDTLKCKLFERQRYGMTLTAEGRRLLDNVQQMDYAASDVENVIKESDRNIESRVRISLSDDLGSFWLTPNLINFQKDHPGIMLDIVTENSFANLAQGEADIAIRLKEPIEKGLKVRKVGVMRFHVFAAPSYVSLYGLPTDWSDLQGHKLIDYLGYGESRALSLWQEKVKHHDRVVLQTNSVQNFVSALRSGLGLGLLPRFYLHKVSGLIVLDLPTDLFETPIYLVTRDNMEQTDQIQTVNNYIDQLFERDRKVWFS